MAGGLLNALVWMPYQMQLAHGWTSLTVFTNSVAVAVVIPTLLWVVPRYGMLGAGWVWASLNLGYIMLHVQLIHRRLLRNEKVSWYCWDVGLPLAMTFGVVGFLRWLLPVAESRIGQALVIALVSGCALLTAAASASAVRARLIQLFVGWRSSRGLKTTEP